MFNFDLFMESGIARLCDESNNSTEEDMSKDATVVYVFGPMDKYEDYQSNKPLDWVKIGMTDRKDDADKEKCSLDRIRQESRTGIPYLCRLYDSFIFPVDGKVDDKVRRKLTSQLYTDLKTSAAAKSDDEYHIKPGKEFVYNVTKSQIKNAVMVYMYEILAKAIENNKDVKAIYDMMSSNLKAEEYEDTNSAEFATMEEFWNIVIRKGGDICSRSNNTKRNYMVVPSKHFCCQYVIIYSKKKNTIRIDFESYARDIIDKGMQFDLQEDSDLKDIIQSAIIANMPNENFFDTQNPKQGEKRPDKWSWSCENERDADDDVATSWVVDRLKKMYDYFENLDIENALNEYKMH